MMMIYMLIYSGGRRTLNHMKGAEILDSKSGGCNRNVKEAWTDLPLHSLASITLPDTAYLVTMTLSSSTKGEHHLNTTRSVVKVANYLLFYFYFFLNVINGGKQLCDPKTISLKEPIPKIFFKLRTNFSRKMKKRKAVFFYFENCGKGF